MPDWLFEALKTRFAGGRGLGDRRPSSIVPRRSTCASTRCGRRAPTRWRRCARRGSRPNPRALAPHGIRLKGKPALAAQRIFIDGRIEVQDEGSQLLASLVAPKRGELVVDFCAGAGGKTLALGDLMRSTGRLYAMDVSAGRLSKLKPRLARSGLSNVHPVQIENERDPKLKRMAGKADRVLVDAPCSGLGTLRRNPDLKWRQTPESVRELTQKQGAILGAAARLLKPGGRLVYATCSLLPDENQKIVDEFLLLHEGFELVSATDLLREQGIDARRARRCGRLISSCGRIAPGPTASSRRCWSDESPTCIARDVIPAQVRNPQVRAVPRGAPSLGSPAFAGTTKRARRTRAPGNDFGASWFEAVPHQRP